MENQIRTPREKPTIIDIGKRKAISSGRWNHDVIAEYIIGRGKYAGLLDIGDLGKLAFGFKGNNSRKMVRKRLSGLKKVMALHYGELLAVEYEGPHEAASKVKVYDPNSLADQELIKTMIDKMTREKDKMLNYYKKVTDLFGSDEELSKQEAAPPVS